MTGSTLERELESLHPASFGWALGCCRWRREEAEEVLQAVYVKVLEGRARFNGRSSLKTWLFSTIRRTAAEQRRRHWLRAASLGRWVVARPRREPLRDPEALLAQSEVSQALLQALRTLPRRQRDLVHLVFYEDLTIEEASRVLGISFGTARTHYHRGKVRLRQSLCAGGRP